MGERSRECVRFVELPDGAYALDLPDFPRYRCQVYGPDGGQPLLNETWEGLPAGDVERDVVLPD